TEADLQRALRQQEFRLHYQPIVSLTTGRMTGCEALIRLQHPERGLLAPDAFMRIAEETGLVVPMDRWVLHAACAQMRAWRDAGLDVRWTPLVGQDGGQTKRGSRLSCCLS
ncbi:MAG: EAL domain-containing protein, partial [Dehalococcoidia bacterium]|nr:EAL domain-containing protein [Dehalococcoidia bacterium]